MTENPKTEIVEVELVERPAGIYDSWNPLSLATVVGLIFVILLVIGEMDLNGTATPWEPVPSSPLDSMSPAVRANWEQAIKRGDKFNGFPNSAELRRRGLLD